MSKTLRDAVLFFAGLAGIGYETLLEKVDRPQLLIIFAAMVGLPAFLRGDERTSPPDEKEKEKEAAKRRPNPRGQRNARR